MNQNKSLNQEYVDSYDTKSGCFAILAAFGLVVFIMAAVFAIASFLSVIL
jgi:hypothetical protein